MRFIPVTSFEPVIFLRRIIASPPMLAYHASPFPKRSHRSTVSSRLTDTAWIIDRRGKERERERRFRQMRKKEIFERVRWMKNPCNRCCAKATLVARCNFNRSSSSADIYILSSKSLAEIRSQKFVVRIMNDFFTR